eukprot:2532559-Alexandrium_andersonii.AAC.1
MSEPADGCLGRALQAPCSGHGEARLGLSSRLSHSLVRRNFGRWLRIDSGLLGSVAFGSS